MSPVERVRLNESGWTSWVELVRLNESSWTSLVERVWLNESGWTMATTADPAADHTACGSQRSVDPLTVDHTVRVSHRLRITVGDHSADPSVDDHPADSSVEDRNDCGLQRSVDPLTAVFTPPACLTDCGSPLMITLADPSTDDPTNCASKRSADPLSADHTVRVTHRLRITVDDHCRWSFYWWSLSLILPLMITPTVDRSVQWTHWLCITPSAYHTDCGSPSMITLADPSVDDHELVFFISLLS